MTVVLACHDLIILSPPFIIYIGMCFCFNARQLDGLLVCFKAMICYITQCTQIAQHTNFPDCQFSVNTIASGTFTKGSDKRELFILTVKRQGITLNEFVYFIWMRIERTMDHVFIKVGSIYIVLNRLHLPEFSIAFTFVKQYETIFSFFSRIIIEVSIGHG